MFVVRLMMMMMMMMIFWRRLANIYPEIPTKDVWCHPRQGWTPPTSQLFAFGRRISVEWCRMPDKSRCLTWFNMGWCCFLAVWEISSESLSSIRTRPTKKGRLNLNPTKLHWLWKWKSKPWSNSWKNFGGKPSSEVFFAHHLRVDATLATSKESSQETLMGCAVPLRPIQACHGGILVHF